MHRFKIAAAAACLALAACAAEVVRQPSELKPTADAAPRSFVLRDSVKYMLDSRYERVLRGYTQFVEVGSIAQGRVLRPTNAVMTVEGKHMHEAYAVVKDDRLIGFYLPVERSFSPLSQPVSLTLEERKTQ